jgi:hypothetical protein
VAALPATRRQPPSAGGKQIADVTRGLQPQPGFIDVWRDTDKGRVLLSVGALEQLPAGQFIAVCAGLQRRGLDRAQNGEMRMVHFEKHGAKLFLVQENTNYVANSADRDERAAVRESFSNSVLWSGEIISPATRTAIWWTSPASCWPTATASPRGWRWRSRAPTRSTCRAAPCWPPKPKPSRTTSNWKPC